MYKYTPTNICCYSILNRREFPCEIETHLLALFDHIFMYKFRGLLSPDINIRIYIYIPLSIHTQPFRFETTAMPCLCNLCNQSVMSDWRISAEQYTSTTTAQWSSQPAAFDGQRWSGRWGIAARRPASQPDYLVSRLAFAGS